MAKSKAVERYQLFLRNLGYDPGAIDGAWGKNTQAAYEAAVRDKKIEPVGSSTSRSTDNTNINSTPYRGRSWMPPKNSNGQYIVPKEVAKECAAWANMTMREYNNNQNWDGFTLGGDAWTRNHAGAAQTIFSGYGSDAEVDKTKGKDIYEKYLVLSKKKNPTQREQAMLKSYVKQLQNIYLQDSIARNKKAAANVYRNFDSKTLDKNKTYIVNMGYSVSPNAGLAWMGSDHGTTGTHTGNLFWNKDHNRWEVAHNLRHNGVINVEDFVSLQNPNNAYGYYVTDIAYVPTKAELGDKYYEYNPTAKPKQTNNKSDESDKGFFSKVGDMLSGIFSTPGARLRKQGGPLYINYFR